MERSSGNRHGYEGSRGHGSERYSTSRSDGRDRERHDRKSESSTPREPSHVQIFVEGLPLDVKIPDLVDHFSSVGKIKIDRESNKPRVWLYHDKRTGDPTGEATITYMDSDTQKRALDTYNGQRFRDRYEMKVTPSIVKPHMARPPPISARGHRGRGARGGPRGGPRGRGGQRGRGEIRQYRREPDNRERNSYSSSNQRDRHPHAFRGSSGPRDRFSDRKYSRR